MLEKVSAVVFAHYLYSCGKRHIFVGRFSLQSCLRYNLLFTISGEIFAVILIGKLIAVQYRMISNSNLLTGAHHMMYLLLRDNKQTGPYSLDELKAKGLKAYDLVWVEGR